MSVSDVSLSGLLDMALDLGQRRGGHSARIAAMAIEVPIRS
jgi:hypothetical protein